MHPKKKRKLRQKQLAKEHITQLFDQADKTYSKRPTFAQKYVDIARKIHMRYKIKLPRVLKRKFCKHCYTYLRADTNARIRIKQGIYTVYCKSCKKFTRIPFKGKNTKLTSVSSNKEF